MSDIPTTKSSVKTIAITAAAVIALAAGGYWGNQWWQAHQKALADDRARSIVALAAQTKDYASVDRAVKAGLMDQDALRKAVKAEFEKQALIRVNNYFGMRDPSQRSAYLDKVIDEMNEFRKNAKPPTTEPSTQPAAPTGNWQAEMVTWALSQPPDQRARLAEFHVAMERRRSERGEPSIFNAPGIMKTAFGGGGSKKS